MEVARLRAKEDAEAVIAEEDNIMVTDDEGDYGYDKAGDVLQQTTNKTNLRGMRRRPLYRQSSMDFINNTSTDNNIDRYVVLSISSDPY